MAGTDRWYRYVGPDEQRLAVRPGSGGQLMDSPAAFRAWVAGLPPSELDAPVTFVVDTSGVLRLAPRRSEHVACAGGGPVLAAGEMTFRRNHSGWTVAEVSNQSTGYCPDGDSWPAVAAACDQAGLRHPGGWTRSASSASARTASSATWSRTVTSAARCAAPNYPRTGISARRPDRLAVADRSRFRVGFVAGAGGYRTRRRWNTDRCSGPARSDRAGHPAGLGAAPSQWVRWYGWAVASGR